MLMTSVLPGYFGQAPLVGRVYRQRREDQRQVQHQPQREATCTLHSDADVVNYIS